MLPSAIEGTILTEEYHRCLVPMVEGLGFPDEENTCA